MIFSPRLVILYIVILVSLIFTSCETIDLYEKNVAIPDHEWTSTFKPEFKFTITDTTSHYQIFIVLRHTGKYNWNNIWIELATRVPGDTATRREKYELPLATNEKWIGTPMDDTYETRVRITPQAGVPMRKGDYSFIVGHIMREDPLKNVMNVGVRVEKIGSGSEEK